MTFWTTSLTDTIEKLVQELTGTSPGGEPQSFRFELDEIKLKLAIEVDLQGGPEDKVSFNVKGSLSLPRPDQRVSEGLSALYTFAAGSGNVVNDVSGAGTALDLTIQDPTRVEWQAGGGLVVKNEVLIASAGPATKITEACKASGELTVEVWIRPATTTQAGPARIVTLSHDPQHRNFTLGQGLWGSQPTDLYDVRIRTTTTSVNGMPSLSSAPGTAQTALTHVVFTRAADGTTTIYLDGETVRSGKASGSLANWDPSYRLALANELVDRRPWHGEYRLVAIYDRALGVAEIRRNFAIGP